MRLDVIVDADRALDMVTTIMQRASEPTPLLQIAAEEMAVYATDVFASRAWGAWAPNDPAWARAKGGGRVLVDTGNLLASLTQPHVHDAVRRVVGEQMLYSTKHPAAEHLKRGSRGMPKRDPLPEPRPDVARRIAQRIGSAVVEGRS